MKKLLQLAATVTLSLALLAGCGNGTDGDTSTTAPEQGGEAVVDETGEENPLQGTVLTVGASITPHAEILNAVSELLAEQGIELKVVEYTDYVQPNMALEAGDLDANYFQHSPYLEQFNVDNDTHLVAVANIHYEPFGIYPGKTATLEDLQDGATIAVPNDGTNEGRALMLLEAAGLITLKEDVGMTATVLDITDNPRNLKIVEMEAAQISLSLPDVDLGVINGNYALQAGLNAGTDSLTTEDEFSPAATVYPNVLVVKEGNEQNPAILALIEALQSETSRQFMADTYQGAVLPSF